MQGTIGISKMWVNCQSVLWIPRPLYICMAGQVVRKGAFFYLARWCPGPESNRYDLSVSGF